MSKEVDNQPLATVNGHVIYAGALSREIELLAATLHGMVFENLAPSQRAELKKNAITKLIREELILESELANLVQPSEDELKASIAEAQTTILVQGGDDIVEDEAFEGRLRTSMQRELVIHGVIDLFLGEAEVSDGEISRYYELHTKDPGMGPYVRDGKLELAEIFLEAEPSLCPVGRSGLIRALKSFKERHEAGENFADLARAQSDRDETKEEGGYLGWKRRGEVNEDAFNNACALEPGGLTGAVELPDGYLMLQVINKELSVLALSEVSDEVKNELRDVKARAGFKEWVAQMMAEADIRVGGDPSTWGKKCAC